MNRLKQFICWWLTGHRNTFTNLDLRQMWCADCGKELNYTYTVSS